MTDAKYELVEPGSSYTVLDQHRDFRQLFLGSDLGKKVLARILTMGHAGRSSAAMAGFDPYKTMYHDGERNLAHRIHFTAHNEPKPRPDKGESHKPLRKVTNG